MKRCKFFVRTLVFLTMVLLTCGCQQNSQSNRNTEDGRYVLDFVDSSPANPAVLGVGQKLNVQAYYSIPAGQQVYVWARPYYKGQRMGSYKAHHLIPVNGNTSREGIAEMWFMFDEPAVIDEVRIFMKENDSDKIIKTTSRPFTAQWK